MILNINLLLRFDILDFRASSPRSVPEFSFCPAEHFTAFKKVS
jgi:hypothetical protein